LIAKGELPVAFADNDEKKWHKAIEGITVFAPEACKFSWPDAKWVATVHRIPARPEILAQLAQMGVDQISLYEFLPARCDLPPKEAEDAIYSLLADQESVAWFTDQLEFRRNPLTYVQRPPRDIANVYFEEFIAKNPQEHYCDCGAADGDSIRDFIEWSPNYAKITAFEPDPENMIKLVEATWDNPKVIRLAGAVSDTFGQRFFTDTHDQTAHLAGSGGIKVQCYKLDDLFKTAQSTFIKMDIEGSELEGLWGAREVIRKHSPVLAICAYHTGDHLWQIPLLIHAINPTYKFYLRRYLEATWELIWYAVPPDRVKI
jgi:FkbM family methyltransferase